MDLSAPYQSMFPTVDSAVLGALSSSTKPRTGRELARLASRSQPATQQVLDRLVEHGLVIRQEAGRARLYTLNREHLAAEPITSLVNLRSLFFQHLRDFFSLWDPPPLHVSVFGSAARGDGSASSDIDIFLVRPGDVDEGDGKWRVQVEALADAVLEWTGNHAGLAEVSEDELDRLRKDRPRILENLEAEAVDIEGPPVRKLLRVRDG